MTTFIKSLNKVNSKFSVNGKLCVLQYGPNKTVESIKYSSALNPDEEKDFKQHLESIKRIPKSIESHMEDDLWKKQNKLFCKDVNK